MSSATDKKNNGVRTMETLTPPFALVRCNEGEKEDAF